MKRFAIFACAIFAATALLGAQAQLPATFYADATQPTKNAIDASRLLQSQGQWSKAWNLLAAFDPDNKDGYVLAEKIDLAMNGNVANGMYISFGFVDLADGQTLEEARANPPEKANTVAFNPLDAADTLEKSGAAIPPVLSYELGNYLYMVNKDYGDNWVQDSQTTQTKAVENYDRALSYDTYTEQSLANHAELLIGLQKYDAAEAVLNKAIAAYPNNQDFTVSLASAYNDQGKFDQVYPLVDAIIAKPETTNTTYNAFIEAIKAGLNADDAQKTDSYADAMVARFPDEYVPMLIQHLIAVRRGTADKANAIADDVTAKFKVDPNVVRSLLSTWLNAEDSKAGIDYLNRSLDKYQSDDKAAGTVLFYRALMYAQTAQSNDDLKLALADLSEAEKRFGTVYEKDNQVFQAIGQLRDEWTQQLAQPAPDASAAPAAPSDQTQPAQAPATGATPATPPAAPATGTTTPDTTGTGTTSPSAGTSH